MKHRITYLVPNHDNFNPEQLAVQGDAFTLKGVDAAKEHRITFSLNELPQEVRRVLKQSHELHIRWASERPFAGTIPFVSRIAPGLHAFFTPLKAGSGDLLCPLLKKIFSDVLKCSSPKESFIQIPILSERFSMSPSTQYYSQLPSLHDLVTYLQHKGCPSTSAVCKDAAESLISADYVDLDYDAISHALILHAFWARDPENASGWTETISEVKAGGSVEIGVLSREENPDPEDVAFSGFLTVLGQDAEPKPTHFQTPLRHHTLPSSSQVTYQTQFSQPTGLHPTLLLTLSSTPTPPADQSCHLHTYLTLPSPLFIDKYQFTDPLFLSSQNLHSLRSIAGATDLEAPDWVIGEWGSASLFQIAVPQKKHTGKNGKGQEEFTVKIPMHARYLPPGNTSHVNVEIPYPPVFWACHSDAGTKVSSSPFDRKNLGFEALFGIKTKFYFLEPEPVILGGKLIAGIDIPVLEVANAGLVEWGTVTVVIGAFLWLVWGLSFGSNGKEGAEKRKEGKKE